MATGGDNGLRLGIVGATGAVGGRLLELIDERAFPCTELKLYSSEDHTGEAIESGEITRPVDVLTDASELSDLDLVFLAVQRRDAEPLLAAISGPIVVDLSAASLAATAAMVAPGFSTREQVRAHSHSKLFHIPHPSALAVATIAGSLSDFSFCAATLMLGASTLGHGAINHLVEESADLLNGKLVLEEEDRQSAFNAALLAGGSELERNLLAQINQLTGKSQPLALQCVYIPVLHGSAVSMLLPNCAASAQWAAALRSAPGILLVENEEPPNVVDAIEQEALLLAVATRSNGTSIWCVFDNARRAALSALWIAECLVPDSAEKLN